MKEIQAVFLVSVWAMLLASLSYSIEVQEMRNWDHHFDGVNKEVGDVPWD